MLLDLSGLEAVRLGLARLINPDARALMVSWEKIIEEDNRKGVLHGLDKDGVPMAAVTYRPKKPPSYMWAGAKATPQQRLNQRANAKRGKFAGFGDHPSGLHNNLTSSEYRLLGGPPLAPREQFSRVVTNLQTGHGHEGDHWFASGAWTDVVDAKGKPFLRYHFDGSGKLPRRDLRGVRPDGMAKALRAFEAWASDLLRQAFGGRWHS